MYIALCDDQPAALDALQVLLHQWETEHGIVLRCRTFHSAAELVDAAQREPFSLYFLDVVMPLLDGIGTAREIRLNDRNVRIVFLTSSPEFAVDSYSVKASNYLLKPLDEDKLRLCLEELWEQYHSNARCIDIKSANTVHRIALPDIAFMEAQNKHVQFTFIDGSSILSSEPLYSYEERLALEDGFFKCSRSYIVNMHQIESYCAKEITMRSGFRIPISRNRHREFEEAYFAGNYVDNPYLEED